MSVVVSKKWANLAKRFQMMGNVSYDDYTEYLKSLNQKELDELVVSLEVKYDKQSKIITSFILVLIISALVGIISFYVKFAKSVIKVFEPSSIDKVHILLNGSFWFVFLIVLVLLILVFFIISSLSSNKKKLLMTQKYINTDKNSKKKRKKNKQ